MANRWRTPLVRTHFGLQLCIHVCGKLAAHSPGDNGAGSRCIQHASINHCCDCFTFGSHLGIVSYGANYDGIIACPGRSTLKYPDYQGTSSNQSALPG